MKAQILEYLKGIDWLADGDAEMICDGVMRIVNPENPFSDKKCCACGEVAHKRYMSIIGQIPYYVCEKHYQETSPAMGFDFKLQHQRIGLMYNGTDKWVDLLEFETN